MNIGKIKEKSLKKLEGNYIIPIIAIIVYGLILFLAGVISKLIYNENMNAFFSLIITGLLYMGLLEITIKIARGKKTDIMDLFKRTDLFWKCIAITIILVTFTLLCTVLEFVAFKSLRAFAIYQTDLNVMVTGLMIAIGVLLCSAIATFYIAIMISCSQAYYVLYENENMPVIDILNRSMDLMETHRLDYILYILSFAGWIIVGIMTFGLLFIWVTPYMMVSNANFYDEIIKIEEKENSTKKKEKKSKK